MSSAARSVNSAGGTAKERLERLLYISVGIAAAVYAVILWPGDGGIARQTPQLASWYALPLILIAIGLPLSLGVLTWIAPRKLVRALAAGTALSFIVAMMLFPLALPTPTLHGNVIPWFQGIHALHGMIVAIVWPGRRLLVYGLVQGIVIGIVQNLVRDDQERSAVLDGAGSFVFVMILIACTVALIFAADRLDRASDEARGLAGRKAAAVTKAREESRIDAMVHDDIMSVLLTASRDSPPASLAERAQAAIKAIDTLEAADATAREYSLSELLHELQDAAALVCPGALVTKGGTGELIVPADVVTALTDALSEALRNSIRHAGNATESVQRTVSLDGSDKGVSVTVWDNGKGFNPRSVPQGRLGIRLSLIERMAMVDGGRARVASRPGHGTTVTLSWRPV